MQGTITPAQLRKLWATAHEVGRLDGAEFDEDALRALVAERTGRHSIRALTAGQAAAVIDEFERKLGRDPEAARRSYARRARASRATDPEAAVTIFQVREIRDLAKKLGWTTVDGVDQVDEGRLRGFYERQVGRPSLRTVREAQKVIEGMRAMLARAPEKNGGEPPGRTSLGESPGRDSGDAERGATAEPSPPGRSPGDDASPPRTLTEEEKRRGEEIEAERGSIRGRRFGGDEPGDAEYEEAHAALLGLSASECPF